MSQQIIPYMISISHKMCRWPCCALCCCSSSVSVNIWQSFIHIHQCWFTGTMEIVSRDTEKNMGATDHYLITTKHNKGQTLHRITDIYSISQEICTRFCCALLCCGYAIVHNEFTWSIYPYSSGLLCWHWGNR